MKYKALPGHLGALVWSGEHRSGGPALADHWGAHQDEGDPLSHHSPWTEEAEEDQDGRQNVAQ